MKYYLLILILASINISTTAQPGHLDPSFGKNGIIRTEFGSVKNLFPHKCTDIIIHPDGSFYQVIESGSVSYISHRFSDFALDQAYGEKGYSVPVLLTNPKAVIQADGKIVIGGRVQMYPTGTDFGLARLNLDGSFDKSFSCDGMQTADFSSSDDFMNSICLQADGKILAAGYTILGGNENFAIARYNTDGSSDMSFSRDGKLTIDFSAFNDAVNQIAVQRDGKIVAAGYSRFGASSSFAVVRYLADGTPDNTFSADGKQTIPLGSGAIATALAIQQDGKLLIAGSTAVAGTSHAALVRLNIYGELDNSFSSDGKEMLPLTPAAALEAVAIQRDGKILTAGYSQLNKQRHFSITRCNPNGSIDNTFSKDGRYSVQLGLNSMAYALRLQPDGTILAGGVASHYTAWDPESMFVIMRLNANGSVANSLVTYKPRGMTIFNAIAIQPDGKLLTGGVTSPAVKSDFAVARYDQDGKPDISFDLDGKLTFEFGSNGSVARAIAVQPDKKLLVAGYMLNRDQDDFALLRLNEDGSADNSFSGDGKTMTDFAGNADGINCLLVQPDGKILVAGYANYPGKSVFALARYHPDGTLDNSFSGDGKLVRSFHVSTAVTTLLLQTDGKILAGGNLPSPTGKIYTIVRYLPDGTPDVSFDRDGVLNIPLTGFVSAIASAALQEDGKIVFAGSTTLANKNDFAILRYNSDGLPDTSFSTDGIAPVDMSSDIETGRLIAIQNDGRIIIGGTVKMGNDDYFGIARIRPDGSLDPNFGEDGKTINNLEYGDNEIKSITVHNNRLYAAGSSLNGSYEGIVAAYFIGNGGGTAYQHNHSLANVQVPASPGSKSVYQATRKNIR